MREANVKKINEREEEEDGVQKISSLKFAETAQVGKIIYVKILRDGNQLIDIKSGGKCGNMWVYKLKIRTTVRVEER